MKKRHLAFFILLILLYFIFRDFFFSVNIVPKQKILSEETSEKRIESESSDKSSIKPAVPAVQVKVAKAAEATPLVLFEKTDVEKIPTQMPTNEKEAQEFLNTKELIEPETEFVKLKDLVFDVLSNNYESPLMHPGIYIDKAAQIRMAFVERSDTGQIGEHSCLIIKNEAPLELQNQFAIREDGQGYIAN